MSIASLVAVISEGVAIIGSIAAFLKYVKGTAAREATQNIKIEELEKKVSSIDTSYFALSTQLASIQSSLASISTDLEWLKRTTSNAK